jgi:hypothetical protein
MLADDTSSASRPTAEICCSGPAPDLLARWSTLARAEMHGIPAARPLLLLRRPTPFLVARLPRSARAIDLEGTASAHTSAEMLASAGALLGALHDRGYRARLEDMWISEASPVQALMVPGHDLTPLAADPAERAAECRRFLARLDVTSATRRAALLAGFASALRGSRLERTELVQVLGDA